MSEPFVKICQRRPEALLALHGKTVTICADDIGAKPVQATLRVARGHGVYEVSLTEDVFINCPAPIYRPHAVGMRVMLDGAELFSWHSIWSPQREDDYLVGVGHPSDRFIIRYRDSSYES